MSTENLYYQTGTLTINYNDGWDGSFTNTTLTFPTAYDEIPNLSFVWGTYGINATPLFVKYINASVSAATIAVRFSSAPTSGTSTIVWHAIGKKVEL